MNHCPVCGMQTTGNREFSLCYHQVDYLFCSILCQHSFENDPDSYITMKMARIAQRNEELEYIRKETIACLSRAAEYKDNETGKHTARIAAYSAYLATLAGLDESTVDLIREASPMHDVGKIGIPDCILLKPARLDAEERAVMQRHAEIGAQILGEQAKSKLMQMAVSIALTHHEKWNGAGYPQGLAGLEIPVAGRLVAICDVFDALISERPYKEAWDSARIEVWMQDQVGEHFDPELARLFLLHFSTFCSIYAHLSDKVSDKASKKG